MQRCSFPERVRILEQEQTIRQASKSITFIVRVQLYIKFINIDCRVGYTSFMMRACVLRKLTKVTSTVNVSTGECIT